MEELFGSDISVSRGTKPVGNMGSLGISDMNWGGSLGPSLYTPDVFLMSGKGRNSGLMLSFGNSPINSIAVDWEVFRKGAGIAIKADGVVIYQELLMKAQRKTGISGHLAPLFFNSPIHTLEFIGINKSKIGIDNLAINVPLADQTSGSFDPIVIAENGGDNEPGNASHGQTGPGKRPPADNKYTGDGQPDAWIGGPEKDHPYSEHQIPEASTFVLFGIGLLMIRPLARAVSYRSRGAFRTVVTVAATAATGRTPKHRRSP
jgi:hypothetical protein